MCFADRGIKKELFSERKPAAQNVRRTEGSRAEALAGVWGGQGPKQCVKKGSGYAFKPFLRNCRYKGTHSTGF